MQVENSKHYKTLWKAKNIPGTYNERVKDNKSNRRVEESTIKSMIGKN